jgi:hypothetical protein
MSNIKSRTSGGAVPICLNLIFRSTVSFHFLDEIADKRFAGFGERIFYSLFSKFNLGCTYAHLDTPLDEFR